LKKGGQGGFLMSPWTMQLCLTGQHGIKPIAGLTAQSPTIAQWQ